MIAHVQEELWAAVPGERRAGVPALRREAQAREQRERDLRFCVVTEKSGAVLVRYFRNPHDSEGVMIRLTPVERDELAFALAMPGAHFVQRDDGPGTEASNWGGRES